MDHPTSASEDPNPLTTTPAPRTVDIAAAIKYPFQTPDWWKTCLMSGVCLLIPVIGFVAHFGWQKRIFDQVRSGEDGPLPEYSLGEDLKHGWRPFAGIFFTGMLFNLLLLMGFGVLLGGGLILSEAAPDAAEILMPIAMIGVYGLQMVAMILLQAYMPEMWRLSFEGRLFPPASAGASFRAIRAAPIPFALTCVGVMVAAMLGGIGVIACYVGFFVTMPLGYAVIAHIVAQWSRVVDAQN